MSIDGISAYDLISMLQGLHDVQKEGLLSPSSPGTSGKIRAAGAGSEQGDAIMLILFSLGQAHSVVQSRVAPANTVGFLGRRVHRQPTRTSELFPQLSGGRKVERGRNQSPPR